MTASKTKWTDYLRADVFGRLEACRTIKSDIPILVNAKWLQYKAIGKDAQGFTKEDALVDVLELLECNSCYFDLTEEEYDDLCR